MLSCLAGKYYHPCWLIAWVRDDGKLITGLYSCKDDQTSADAQEAGKATGAMSYAFTSK